MDAGLRRSFIGLLSQLANPIPKGLAPNKKEFMDGFKHIDTVYLNPLNLYPLNIFPFLIASTLNPHFSTAYWTVF